MPPKKRNQRNASPTKKAGKEKEGQICEKIIKVQEPPAKKNRNSSVSKPGNIL